MIGKAAACELNHSPDQDACNMARTAIHLREHIFYLQQRFDGEFATSAHMKSISPILTSFIDMILCGPSVKHNSKSEDDMKSVALSIAQQLIYNAVKKKHTKPVTNTGHKVDREASLAIIGRAKRAPHWGVQSGLHVIYILCACVCRGPKSVGRITWAKRAHAQSHGR